MTQPSDILHYRDLLDRLVLNGQTMEEVGRVDTLWMYPQRNRVLGVICRPGRFGAKRLVFKLTQLDTVGEESLLMQGDPEPTVAAKVQQLESLIGQEVWSDRGDRVGKIIDCLFNPDNGVILRYLMTPGAWAAVTDGTYLLSPKQIISFSAKRTLIAADTIDALEIYQPGLRQRLAQIRDMLKEEYVDSVTRELRSLSSQVQGFAQRAQGQMETLMQRTRERAQTLSQDFSRDAQEIIKTIQTDVQSAAERIDDIPTRFNDGFPSPRSVTDELGEISEEDALENALDEDWEDWPTAATPAQTRRSTPQPSVSQNPEPGINSPTSPPAAAEATDEVLDAWDIEEPVDQGQSADEPIRHGPTAAAAPNPTAAADTSDRSTESGESPDLTVDERDIWDDWDDDLDSEPSEDIERSQRTLPRGDAPEHRAGTPPSTQGDEDDLWI